MTGAAAAGRAGGGGRRDWRWHRAARKRLVPSVAIAMKAAGCDGRCVVGGRAEGRRWPVALSTIGSFRGQKADVCRPAAPLSRSPRSSRGRWRRRRGSLRHSTRGARKKNPEPALMKRHRDIDPRPRQQRASHGVPSDGCGAGPGQLVAKAGIIGHHRPAQGKVEGRFQRCLYWC